MTRLVINYSVQNQYAYYVLASRNTTYSNMPQS